MFEYRVLFRAKDSGYYRPINVAADCPENALSEANKKKRFDECFASLEFMGKADG